MTLIAFPNEKQEAALSKPVSERAPFCGENLVRNAHLATQGQHPPKALKTGTTIAGLVFKDGAIIAADTRATAGPVVADKNCEKLHYIAPNIFCAGAGTAADTEQVTAMASAKLALLRLNMGKQSRVAMAETALKRHLFRYQGHVGAHLILAGVDCDGSHVVSISAHGSTHSFPFTTMGSGSLAAMSILEAEWKPDLNEEEAKDLAHRAISRGVLEDLGSGFNVDIRVIRNDGTSQGWRAWKPAE